jgi:type VI secretion system protein ImpB
MSSESYQTRLKRVRPPRVMIQYDVDTGGAMKKVELPFVVGVLADLSAQSKVDKRPLPQRRFVPIDRDNFNDVMAKAEPRLAYTVEDKLTNDPAKKISVELMFKSLQDFDPAKVAEQVPILRKLLQMRRRLKELLSRTEGNDKLVGLLQDVLSNTNKRQAALDALKAAVPDQPVAEGEAK